MTDGRASIIDFLCQNGAEVNLVGPSEHVSLKSLVELDNVNEKPESGKGKESQEEKMMQKRLLNLTRAHGEEYGEVEGEEENVRNGDVKKGKESRGESEEGENGNGMEQKLKELHGIKEEDDEESEEEGKKESERVSLAVAGGIMPIHCAAFIGNSENIFALSRHRADVNALCEVNRKRRAPPFFIGPKFPSFNCVSTYVIVSKRRMFSDRCAASHFMHTGTPRGRPHAHRFRSGR